MLNAVYAVFSKTNNTKYLLAEVRGKAMCLGCGEQITVDKDSLVFLLL